MQPSPKAKPTEPNGGGGPVRNADSLRDCCSQIHPCELLYDHPKGSGRVLVHEEPGEFGTSGLTGAGRALFMANGTLDAQQGPRRYGGLFCISGYRENR